MTGARRTAPEPERVLTTLLFTDIVGSTEHVTRLGDSRWKELLERHNELMRRELDRFRGRELRTTGDGFFAAFDSPTQAIRCAAAVRDSVRPLGLELRAGVHAGECELHGDDLGGIAVHIGARVAEMAGAGEILVSSTVRELVAGSACASKTLAPVSSRACRASVSSSPPRWSDERRAGHTPRLGRSGRRPSY